MHRQYGCRVALRSPAHITIISPYWMDPLEEPDLFADVDSVSRNFSAFAIATNNFSAFKPRTIFIGIKPNEQLDKLNEHTNEYFSKKPAYKITTGTRPFYPHITIATRDLLKKSFFEAWPHFENRTFEEEWMADGISVLRHNKTNWEIVHAAHFRQC